MGRPEERADWVPIVAGLLAGLTTVAMVSGQVLMRTPNFALAAGRVAVAMLISALVAGAAVGLVCRYRPQSGSWWRIAFSTAKISVWLVPLVVLTTWSSVWAVAAGAMVVLAAAALAPVRRTDEGPDRSFVLSLAAALCFQVTVFALGSRWMEMAVALFAGATAICLRLAALPWTGQEDIPARPRQNWQSAVFLLVLMASVMTLWRRPESWTLPAFASDERVRSAMGITSVASSDPEDSHRGVIVMSQRDQMALVAPRVAAPSQRIGFSAQQRSPMEIPFAGVYWIFRAPDKVPPKNSYTTKGRMDKLSFRANDRRPLVMEARQNLGTFVELRCCGRIDLEIWNSDRYPGTVGMELVLVDTQGGGSSRVSLGTQLVRTRGRRYWMTGGSPYVETLTFQVPANSGLERFDEVLVRFHLAEIRNTRSARIAVERFVLVPRGA